MYHVSRNKYRVTPLTKKVFKEELMVLKEGDLEKVINVVRLASEKIIGIYNSPDFKIDIKKDNTPLTQADKLSHEIIAKGLKNLFPEIPIISEESQNVPFEERKKWKHFWLLDPLDGTKEFISRNGEFTVNLALVQKDHPILGIIAIPVQETVYFAQKGKGSFKRVKGNKGISLPVGQAGIKEKVGDKIVVARSRSHADRREEEIISGLGNTEIIIAGSSLKFCYVAERKADIYLRLGPTMEWDTAAGQCIVECAGAKVVNLQGSPLKYNKPPLKNVGFICIGGTKKYLEKIGNFFQVKALL